MLPHTLRYISALVIAVLVLSPVVAQQTSAAPIQVGVSDTSTSPLYRYGQHVGDSSAPFTARWASIYQKRNAQVFYELCNAGSSAFVFNWDGRWGVGQHNAVKPHTCPFVTFAAPNGVESGDAVIKYGPNRGNWNAVVHTQLSKQEPKPRPTGLSARFGVSYRPQLLSPDASPSVESVSISIEVSNEETGARYEVQWSKNIGPLALQIMRSDPAVAQEVNASFTTSRNTEDVSIEYFPAIDLVKYLPKDEFERLPPDVLKGSYLLITPKVPQGHLSFRVKTGSNMELGSPLTLILNGNKEAVLYFWRHVTLVGSE